MQTKCISQYIQKSQGLKTTILSLHSSNSNEQSWFNRVFFGEKNEITEIPISEYRVEKSQLNLY